MFGESFDFVFGASVDFVFGASVDWVSLAMAIVYVEASGIVYWR